MGQSNSSEYTSDTESLKRPESVESPRPLVAASIANFFGIFSAKQDDIIDSTDSDITVHESGTGKSRNRNRANRNADKVRRRIEQHKKHHPIRHEDLRRTELVPRRRTLSTGSANYPLPIEECDATGKELQKRVRIFSGYSPESKKRTKRILKKLGQVPSKADQSKGYTCKETSLVKYSRKRSESEEDQNQIPIRGALNKSKAKTSSLRSCVTFGTIENLHEKSGGVDKVKSTDATSNDVRDSEAFGAITVKPSNSVQKPVTKFPQVSKKSPEVEGVPLYKNSSHGFKNKTCKPVHEVMNDYQKYSREPPERDQGPANCFAPHTMKSCCRNCCVSLQKNIVQSPKCNKTNFCNKINTLNCSNQKSSTEPPDVGDVSSNLPREKATRNISIGTQKGKILPPWDHRPQISEPSQPLSKFHEPIVQQRHSLLNKSSAFTTTIESASKNSPQVTKNSTENSKQMYNQRNYNHSKQCHSKTPYSFEEATEGNTYSQELDASCGQHCNGYKHCALHRACRCQCTCDSENYYPKNISDDQISCCSDSSNTEYMNLAYQRTGDYPDLVDELGTTLSQRNKMRVQKTMQKFEILSRQNKNLDKPIFDDEESVHNYRKHCNCKMQQQAEPHDACKCPSCCKRLELDTAQCSLASNNYKYSNSSSLQTKKPGYVEKLARYLDPKLNEQNRKHAQRGPYKPAPDYKVGWQLDARKGEWVKVFPRENQYDFESNYPPLPPRPRTNHVYDDRHSRKEFQHLDNHCQCLQCIRRSR